MNSSTSGEFAPAPPPAQTSPDLVAPETEAALSSLDFCGTGTDSSARDQYWRREVAARLERYRSRRKPRGPRYPSLRLPFDSAESPSFSSQIAAVYSATVSSTACTQTLPVQPGELHPQPVTSSSYDPLPRSAAQHSEVRIVPLPTETEFSNLIEFPRSAVIPVFRGSELADPVFDRPRIVEAPELLPAPPALGGILIETIPNRVAEKRAGEFPLQPASLGRRMLACLMDLLILAPALAGFAAIFYQINPGRPPLPLLAVGLLAVTSMLWSVYEFLFVVYTGSTPGWRIARLRLVRFDGSTVSRHLRRWRVLASFLSAFSLVLGYLWSILDEDGLCWHDRITRTCLQSAQPGNQQGE